MVNLGCFDECFDKMFEMYLLLFSIRIRASAISGENVSKSCVVFPQLNILSVIILVQIINLSRVQ